MWSEALRYTAEERTRRCIERVCELHHTAGTWDVWASLGVPPVPDSGASEAELLALESKLCESLPNEYRAFLALCRYLIVGDGRCVWGFEHNGTSVGWPWVSDEHRRGTRHLVFADYWHCADGDQLLFEVGDPTGAVFVYEHEGPRIEPFAPSFSLALWRMVNGSTQEQAADLDAL